MASARIEMSSKVQLSHTKLLKEKNPAFEYSSCTNENIGRIIDSLKTGRGKSLSDNYKASILATIKKNNKTITKNPKQLGWLRKRNNNKLDNEIYPTLIKVAQYAFTFSYQAYDNVNRTMIDTIIALLLVCFVNCSLHDLYSITITELKALASMTTIERRGSRIVPTPKFAHVYQKISDLVKVRSDMCGQIDIILAVSVNPDAINKKIHDLAVMYNGKADKFYGLRIFTSLPKSIFIPTLLSRESTDWQGMINMGNVTTDFED